MFSVVSWVIGRALRVEKYAANTDLSAVTKLIGLSVSRRLALRSHARLGDG